MEVSNEENHTPMPDDMLDLTIGEELEDNLVHEVCKPIIEAIDWPG